jgi:hypothetical protein
MFFHEKYGLLKIVNLLLKTDVFILTDLQQTYFK